MKRTTLATLNTSYQDPFSPQMVSVASLSLEITSGPQAHERLVLDRELMQIGRGDWCDLTLSHDAKVSKEHCELQRLQTGILVRDLESRNGVFINGVRIYEAELPVGGSLRLGDTELRLCQHQAQQEIEVSPWTEGQELLGQSPQMRKIFALIKRLGPRDLTVCITGETGTGKTSLARALHHHSARKDRPFVSVNCGAISATLIEASFFGHEKGAFTGADRVRKGYFEQADGGTLFLDELGELPLALQPKLLDVLESGRVMRLGGEAPRHIDVRVITSTHKDLAREVQRGNFRQDLFYRLYVAELSLPPLRERPEDIPLLAQWFLKQQEHEGRFVLTDDAMEKLQAYLWPGNVRQLRNVLEQATAFHEQEPTSSSHAIFLHEQDLFLPPLVGAQTVAAAPLAADASAPLAGTTTQAAPTKSYAVGPEGSFGSLKDLIAWTEQQALQDTLSQTSWNVSEAARRLQITTTWLYNRLKKYEMTRPSDAKKSA